ncbi:NmrA family NAD(P)-binding protein [Nocardiopsis sp. NPDC057823]|uniref:NmrA family NAD(P)-binding protein n=1 Tax=Nocardiopsis sp. NPDC057823 TaxID=3346256 RepID=UPI00366C69C2
MIVLTGPTGNIGTELLNLLSAQEDPPPYRVAAHSPERLRARLGRDVPAVAFDYDDRSTWPAVLDGATSLFLLFPLPSPRTVRTRMVPFIDAAVAAGVGHIVYVSVPGAQAGPIVPHNRVEAHLRASGVGYTILRCGFFMQNLCRAVSTHGVDIVERGELFVPAGRGRTVFLDARDVAEAVRIVLQDPAAHAGRTLTLTGPWGLDMDEVAAVLSTALDRPVRYTRPDPFRFAARLLRRGVSWDTVGFMAIVYTLTRWNRNDTFTTTLPELLGRPATTMEEWARDYRPVFDERAWT